jgi:predicted RNase H-like nuclease (RuvC/YqgF family)
MKRKFHQIYDKDRDKLKNTIAELTKELQEKKEKNEKMKKNLLYLDKK